jgi:hypothetical protein
MCYNFLTVDMTMRRHEAQGDTLTMTIGNPAILTQIIGFGGFIWVGLYLLVRATHRTPLIILSVIALFCQAVFFGYNALADSTQSRALFIGLERWAWWSTVIPLAIWFHVSSLIARHVGQPEHAPPPPMVTPLVLGIYAWAGAMIVAATTTSLFIDHTSVTRLDSGHFQMYAGPAYPVYIIYNGLVTLGALANFVQAIHTIRRDGQASNRLLVQHLRLLTAGALLFLVGALWLPIRYNWSLDVSAIPGNLALFTGLVVIGYGIARFGLMLEGQDVQRDFLYNLTSIILVNLLYIGLLVAAGQASVALVLALVGLATLTHTAFDNGRSILDRFFFSRDERAARAEARDYATALGTAPVSLPTFAHVPTTLESEPDEDEPLAPEIRSFQVDMQDIPRTPKAFKDTVRKALTNLKSPPQLAKSPLLALELVGQRMEQEAREDNRLNRAATLRELLIEQIDALQPNDTASSQTGDAWRFYNVLYYPYVREISRKSALAEWQRLEEARRRNGQREAGTLEQVLRWLADVDENTFYKWQRRASDTIATMLWEESLKRDPHTSMQLAKDVY